MSNNDKRICATRNLICWFQLKGMKNDLQFHYRKKLLLNKFRISSEHDATQIVGLWMHRGETSFQPNRHRRQRVYAFSSFFAFRKIGSTELKQKRKFSSSFPSNSRKESWKSVLVVQSKKSSNLFFKKKNFSSQKAKHISTGDQRRLAFIEQIIIRLNLKENVW